MLTNLNKIFDRSALVKRMQTIPNPSLQLLEILFGGTNGKIHRNIKVGLGSDVLSTKNIPHSSRSGTPYSISDNELTLKECVPQPFKLERAMTASEINDLENTYRAGGLGSAQQWAVDLAVRFRNTFLKSAQAMTADFIANKGTVNFYNHKVGANKALKIGFDYPNKSDWITYSLIGSVWNSASLIKIYNDLDLMAKKLLVENGLGGTFTVLCASDVFSQILGKVQAYQSTATFPVKIENSYIQLGVYRIYDVIGTYYDYTTSPATSKDLITSKKVYMFSNEAQRQLLWCRMDVIRGSRTFVDGTMDIQPYQDVRNDQWLLKGQSKPFPLINPASVIESTVLS